MSKLIQWPRAKYWDKAWNPIIGCRPCSPACANCYAAAWAERFGQSFEPHATKQKPPRKGVVFCGNMTDLFGEWVRPYSDCNVSPEDLIARASSRKATYLWLTKRVKRMCDTLSIGKFTAVDEEGECHCVGVSELDLSNHYFGFTAENDNCFHARRAEIMDNRGQESRERQNFWISAEPLLGPIDMYAYLDGHIPFKWVVVGCESGPGRRDCRIEWVERIVECCQDAEVPVFIKQLDLGGECVTDINRFPEHLRIRQVPWAKEGESK